MTLDEKVKLSIQYLKAFEPKTEPYYVCYSGGKDSDVIRILCDMAGVNYELHNNHTTMDAPETVYYIREVMKTYGDRKRERIDGSIVDRFGEKGFVHYPNIPVWKNIIRKGVPTRISRWCCYEYKEKGGKGRLCVTGVRKAESTNRKNNSDLVSVISNTKRSVKKAEENGAVYRISKKGGIVLNTDNDENRRFVESCYRTDKTMVNPIIEWTDDEVWEFLKQNNCESNPLYRKGHKRVGCVGCPMSSRRKKDFSMYPKFRENYVGAFDRMLARRWQEERKKEIDIERGWIDGEAVMRWWIGENPLQMTIDDYLKTMEANDEQTNKRI